MVSTKRVSRKESYWDRSPWDLGAVIVAMLGTILLLVSFLSRPQIEILHHTVVLTQGIVAPAIVLGAITWALIEYFTPPGVSVTDLLVRIIPAFVVGGFLGGLLGYYYHFGQYVIEPAFAGNPNAVLFLVAALVAGLATTWNAAWAHKHGFLGQRSTSSGRARPLHASESGTAKGRRGILALLVIFLVFVLIVPVGAALGQFFVSGHDSSPVLTSQSAVKYISSSSGPVPFAQANGTATFDFPSTTKDNVTTYDHTVFIETNLTLAELNNFAASKITLSTDIKNYTVIMGLGNASRFAPLLSSYSQNETMTIPLYPYEILANQSQPVTFEVTANATAMSIHIYTYGNNGLVTIFGPYPVIQFSYILGAVLLFAASFFELSMYDINLKPNALPGGGRR